MTYKYLYLDLLVKSYLFHYQSIHNTYRNFCAIFRNEKMLADLKTTLNSTTKLCVACDITLKTEYIKTLTIQDWKNENPDLHKRPTIFIIHKE